MTNELDQWRDAIKLSSITGHKTFPQELMRLGFDEIEIERIEKKKQLKQESVLNCQEIQNGEKT